MTTTEEMAEFIELWTLVQEARLTQERDEIKWRWTATGVYTAKSAYRAQFHGSHNTFDSKGIWTAKVEDKHRVFMWLLVQCKLLTADKLLSRNWPCHPVCALCDQAPETAEHMCLHCVYA